MGAPLKELAVSRSDIFWVDPRHLKVMPGLNSRVAEDPANKEHIEEIARSAADGGIREPLTVFRLDGETYVSDGHCRLAGALLAIRRGAELESVPVKTELKGGDEGDRVFSQIIRNSGKPLSPFEQGSVYKRLLGLGWNVQKIADKSGKSTTHVNGALELQGAPIEAKALVASGKVSASLASKVIRESGATKGTEKLKSAVAAAAKAGKSKATAKDVEKTAPAQKTVGRDPEAIERLIKHLVRAARAGDEKLVKWLAEADISID